jgi:hypothetical protein
VVAVATGADAVLDALADLGRQWLARIDLAADEAAVLAADLRRAAVAYAQAERDAAAGGAPGQLWLQLDLDHPGPAPAGGAGDP